MRNTRQAAASRSLPASGAALPPGRPRGRRDRRVVLDVVAGLQLVLVTPIVPGGTPPAVPSRDARRGRREMRHGARAYAGAPGPYRASDRRRAPTRQVPGRHTTVHDVSSAAPIVHPPGGGVVEERVGQARRGRGHHVVWMVGSVGALIGLVAGCGGHESVRLGLAGRVDRMAKELADGGAHNVIVLVSDRGRVYVATHGARATQRFRVGSVTKTFTAAIVLELAADGRLRLSDTLERYLPGVVPAGDRITIRELLDHRSGLANYVIYPAWQLRLKRSSRLHPIDALRFAAAQPLDFAPGSQWEYS